MVNALDWLQGRVCHEQMDCPQQPVLAYQAYQQGLVFMVYPTSTLVHSASFLSMPMHLSTCCCSAMRAIQRALVEANILVF